MKYTLLLLMSIFCLTTLQAQPFGIGLTVKNDLYQRYSNPKDEIASGSAGSFLLNFGLGPKFWVGGEDFSVSVEGSANIAPLALSTGDFKGLGAGAFPLMMKFNFQGLSGVNKEGKFGLSIGGGIQYSRTELFGLKNSFAEDGVERKLFKTYIGEIAYGFGMSGFAGYVFLRYGRESDTKANTFNFGLGYDINIPRFKELTDPEF
jgi:hypothetical protein